MRLTGTGAPTARQTKEKYVEQYSQYDRKGSDDGWHFLTGDASAIESLTQAVGFRYVWDENTQQFAHPAGIVIVTPEGTISHYLFGVEYSPKDMRLALVDSGGGRTATLKSVPFV